MDINVLVRLIVIILQNSKICYLDNKNSFMKMIADIFKKVNVSNVDIQLIESKFSKIELRRKEFLVEPGTVVRDLYYIEKGCLRTYLIDNSGKEHTLQFAVNDWWISDYITLFNEKTNSAVSYIECIKDVIAYQISKDDFNLLCKEIPGVAHYHINKLENAFASFQNRILQNLTLDAKQRYINFIDTYPDIEKNVRNYHIASFLGITTESLSRIRKEIASV